MPKMGITVSEGTILEWRKQPGDWIEADETIADVTTDKVDVEIPSPASGRLATIVAAAGDTVPVGEPIAEIDSGAKAGEAHPDEDDPPAAAAVVRREAESETDRSGFISPVVRRIADKHDIDLSQVEGTGIGGRVRKKDVLAHVKERERRGEGAAGPPQRVAVQAGSGRPSRAEASGNREPLTPMRKAIAEHMLASRATSAHCTTIVEVDMSRVAARRAELKAKAAGKPVPTYLAFVARAAVERARGVPGAELVARRRRDRPPRRRQPRHRGRARRGADRAGGPARADAQRPGAGGVDRRPRRSGARTSASIPDDVHGGTFTITNPGQFGAVLATPIINQPQVAILDLEAIVKRPVVVEGPDGDSIAIRPMTYLCMSWDHRVLDGADAARFLSSVKRRLEGGEYE